MKDIEAKVYKYKRYGFAVKKLVKQIGISLSRFYEIRKRLKMINFDTDTKIPHKQEKMAAPVSVNRLTQQEKKTIIEYSLLHPNYFHRELAYRMMDENVVCVSPSSVYRILSEAGLIKQYQVKTSYKWTGKYSNRASLPDELWQTDITYLRYKNKDVYQLSFIDVYSRFITLSVTLTNMTSDTVSRMFEDYIKLNRDKLMRMPVLQSDNGSCYIGNEFKSVLIKFQITHNLIHPGTPTENAIIERWNKTFKELVYEQDEPNDYEELLQITQKACHYYNYERYHKSLGYVTPFTFYRGDPQVIFKEREKKMQEAKQKRIDENKLNRILSISNN